MAEEKRNRIKNGIFRFKFWIKGVLYYGQSDLQPDATVPIFLLMVLGFILKKLGLIDDVFASKMNKFVFLVPLPVLLFEDLSTVDFSQVWGP